MQHSSTTQVESISVGRESKCGRNESHARVFARVGKSRARLRVKPTGQRDLPEVDGERENFCCDLHLLAKAEERADRAQPDELLAIAFRVSPRSTF